MHILVTDSSADLVRKRSGPSSIRAPTNETSKDLSSSVQRCKWRLVCEWVCTFTSVSVRIEKCANCAENNKPKTGGLFLVNARPFPEQSSSIATFSVGRAWLEARVTFAERGIASKLAVVSCSCFFFCLSHLRPRLHEDDVKTIGTKPYLSGKKSYRIGLLFTRRRSVSANFWTRYEDDRKSGNFWRRYGNDMPSSSFNHHIRIDRSGSYHIVMGIHCPRTQAFQSLHFLPRVGLSCWRVGIFSESIASFEARSWQCDTTKSSAELPLVC